MAIIRKNTIHFYCLLVFLYGYSNIAQVYDGGTHEQWEYALEGAGDVLQLALPVSAGITTII